MVTPAPWWAARPLLRARRGLRTAARFLALLAAKARRDGVILYSAALGFVTVCSLIPLLAAFSFIGRRFFSQYEEKVVSALAHILPYSEQTILVRIREFVQQAETLPGFGLIGFALVSLAAFGAIEEILNRIWDVDASRPFRVRLLSFTLVLFWGPLVMGACFSVLLLLAQRDDLEVLLDEAWLLRFLPFIAVAGGLSMLYWLVPYTVVRFRHALAGGVSAALLFELLRWGFGLYVDALAAGANVIYGGFALALFFMLSVEAAWVIALLGGEIAYVAQHYRALDRARRAAEPPREAWTALVALAVIAERFRRGEPVTAVADLADRLVLPPSEIRRSLVPLAAARVVFHPGDNTEQLALATDPHAVAVADVLELFETERRKLLEPLPAALGAPLEALRQRIRVARDGSLGRITVAELTAPEAAGDWAAGGTDSGGGSWGAPPAPAAAAGHQEAPRALEPAGRPEPGGGRRGGDAP